MNLDWVAEKLKGEAVQLFKEQALRWLVKQAPKFFGNAIVNVFVSWIFERVLTIAIQNTELGAYVVRTEKITAQQAEEYATEHLAAEHLAEFGTREEYERQKLAARRRARDLIKYAR